MKGQLTAFASGSLFAVGLALSGMTMPSKVVGFLDLTGAWDPSLAFVMLGAIGVHLAALRLVQRHRKAPLFAPQFHLPTRRDVDARVMAGASVFGIGWGLGGFCPGPALVAAGAGLPNALVFVLGMTAGMLLEQRATRWLDRPGARP